MGPVTIWEMDSYMKIVYNNIIIEDYEFNTSGQMMIYCMPSVLEYKVYYCKII